MYFMHLIKPFSSHRIWTKGFFKQMTAGLNSKFLSFLTRWLTKSKELSLLFYCLIAEFIPFQRALPRNSSVDNYYIKLHFLILHVLCETLLFHFLLLLTFVDKILTMWYERAFINSVLLFPLQSNILLLICVICNLDIIFHIFLTLCFVADASYWEYNKVYS